MNIRWKVIALIAALFTVLGAAGFFVADRVLRPSFVELEHSDADVAMRRIHYALESTLDQLALSATGWGNWSDAYRFMQDPDNNLSFVSENFTDVGLKQLKVNALLYVRPDGTLATAATIDVAGEHPIEFDFMRHNQLPENFPWRVQLRAGRAVRGLLKTSHGILMLAASPVLDGYNRGPALGMAMLGRLLSPAELARIAAQAQATLTMLAPLGTPDADRLLETDALTQVYRSYDDLYGQPVMTLRVDVPRNITRRGAIAVRYTLCYLAGAAVIVLTLLMLLLDKLILNPLDRVTRHAVALGEGRDLTTRLDSQRSDEIGVLAREFDRMVARVAESRDELVDQSFRAGFAELAKGVLHNLGNAMTPIGVRLANARGRLRAAPLEELELATSELRQGTAEPDRRADLQEFMLLACESLAETLKATAEDVEVMTRQTGIVQSALAEQLRSTHNEHVVETVRLTELIAQSLEVVPDGARQRLQVSLDESLAQLPPLELARTVLRLVLQNFIINAADSVAASGKPQGSLRISGEIIAEAGREQLHLVCTDDGVGIAPAHLPRLFEKGFSTKSRETNFGVGLHWCANALGSLGGRVWAISAGTGRGASMHLQLPLASANLHARAA